LLLDTAKPDFPRHIAIEGHIGPGKTGFTKPLAARVNYETLLEHLDANPFLERFHLNRRQTALPTQLYFLFEHNQQIKAMRQGGMFEPVRIADFLLENDRLFAEINLDHDDIALYDNVYSHLAIDALTPDLVIYLQAPVSALMEPIALRDIATEQLIEKAYLAQLADADYNALLAYVGTVKRARHYDNPSPSMI